MSIDNQGELGSDRIPLIEPDLPTMADLAADLDAAFKSGAVTNFGPLVRQFETETAGFIGGGVSAVSTSSGTMGLLFALQALGVGAGDKVAIPSFTFTATAQAVLYAGATPVFVDVAPDLTMDPVDLAFALDRHRPAAVIPVHVFGLPAEVDAIREVVDAHRSGCAVIYDAAHAFGSEDQGRRVGSFGSAEVFSLSATKALVAVEGGLVTTGDPELDERLRKMRNYGIEADYNAWHPGLNGKMSEMHAAVGLFNLRRLPELLARRRELARRYLDQIRRETSFLPVESRSGVEHTYKDFAVLIPEGSSIDQTRAMEMLGSMGIETRRYFFPPLHEQKRFVPFQDRELPRTDTLSRRVICLPFFTNMSERQVERVVGALATLEQQAK